MQQQYCWHTVDLNFNIIQVVRALRPWWRHDGPPIVSTVWCDGTRAYQYICTWKYMDDNVGHVVPAIEKSILDQVLSRRRPRSRWGPPLGALIPGGASPRSPLPTRQVAGESVLASSRCGGCYFRFFVNFPKCLFVRIDTHLCDNAPCKKTCQ